MSRQGARDADDERRVLDRTCPTRSSTPTPRLSRTFSDEEVEFFLGHLREFRVGEYEF